MKSPWKRYLLAWIFVLLSVAALFLLIRERSRVSVLKMDSCEQAEFREQCLSPQLYTQLKKLEKKGESISDLLTVTMLDGGFYPERLSRDKSLYLKYKREEFFLLRSCYEAIWSDLVYFPIPGGGDISYEDSWLAPREYGGDRLHEGTDLFGLVETSGYYPVISMTDGTVEKVGWLPLGGYRIGIRAPHGGYFYYAHLSSYDRDFSRGEQVEAGDILGYMGNTGYGPEGTMGQFPVHLHLGIYIRTPSVDELSVNPYWILKSLEKSIRRYTY
ncbi:MAG: M23 family metallopeptidase [Eubacteriales bacterium]|nr:M23 family metallopeptidase [Eubacteriales bacterium]